jgi:hypothetical protein
LNQLARIRVIYFNILSLSRVQNRKVHLCLFYDVRILIREPGKRTAPETIAGLEQLTPNINDSPPDSQPSKRTLQNRKAQREFRERKASYVKSLEQRIRAYESNEVQGNIELQRAARRLKEENDQLRKQVRQLSERLSMLDGGNSAIAAMPPTRALGRSRGTSGSTHQEQQSQPPPQALYNQPQGFTNDVTYAIISSESSFPSSASPQGYPQYFAQQVCFR